MTSHTNFVEISRHPRFAKLPHFGLECRGHEMAEAGIDDGDTIVCVRWEDTRGVELDGIFVVVEHRPQGGALRQLEVMQTEIEGDKLLLHPNANQFLTKPLEFPRGATQVGDWSIFALVVRVIKNTFPL